MATGLDQMAKGEGEGKSGVLIRANLQNNNVRTGFRAKLVVVTYLPSP